MVEELAIFSGMAIIFFSCKIQTQQKFIIYRAPSSKETLFVARVIYDLLFFFIVIIIVLNLIFGVIIDTFADLRSEKQQKELILKNTCFVCGLNRSAFDNKTVSFEEHIKNEHNMWHYLYFIVLVKVKDPTEFTGPESYVHAMVKVFLHSLLFLSILS